MRTSCFFGTLALLGSLVGCVADSPASLEEATRDPLVRTAWSDNVEVLPDRLVFAAELRSSAESDELIARITRYEAAYAAARAKAPASLADGSDDQDAWVVQQLREDGIEPVFLVGRREAGAVLPDGSIRRGLKNPNGYLRRAIGLTDGPNGEIVVLTAQATLAEAHEELERLGMLKTRAPDGTDDHWEWSDTFPFSIANVDLSKVLYQKTFGAGLGTVRVGFVNSHLRVGGNLEAHVAGRWVNPRIARAILTTNIEGQLVLEGSFDNAFGVSSGDIDLYERSFDIASVGGFPLTLDFEVTGQCDLAANGQVRATAGARMDGSLEVGGTYLRDEGFSGVWQPTWPAFTHVTPTLTSRARIEGRCAITATARAHLFDALGPEASASTYLRLEASSTTSGASGAARAKVFGGVDSRIGGTLRPFGVELATLSGTPYRREWLLFDEPIALP